MKSPKVFISYSWDSIEHKDWVTAFANELRRRGIDAIIDEFITQRETVNLNQMMIEKIRDTDYTLVVLTDKYAEKADSFKGGVGYETSLLVNEIRENIKKIIPIMRFKGDVRKAIPFYLKGVTYIDFSSDPNFYNKIEELKYKLLKKDRIEIEPLGEIYDLKPRKVTMKTIQEGRNVTNSDDIIPNFRKITDRDKTRFMKKSYTEIIDYLSQLAEQTKQRNYNFDYEMDVVTNKKAIIRYYINDMEKQIVKIWLANNFSREENILILYNGHMIDSDNSCNEMITCEVDANKNLKLKMTMQFYGDREVKDASEIAILIWKHIMQYFK